MGMIHIITELDIVDLSCGWSIIIVFADQFVNMLWRHQRHLLQDSRELLNCDVTGVRWVEVLEGRFEQNSVCFNDVFDVEKSLDENLFLIIGEFCV